jgi:hypothetical protein
VSDVTALVYGDSGLEEQALESLRGTRILRGPLEQTMRQAQTEFVLLFPDDCLAGPGLVGFLKGLAWNADVVYPNVHVFENGEYEYTQHADFFTAKRLEQERFIPRVALVRRKLALEAGGEGWQLWKNMHALGARFKPCQDAKAFARREPEPDDPLPVEAKATFYSQYTPATTYLRCQLPARHLPGIVRQDPAARMRKNEGVEEIASPDDFELEFPGHVGAAIFQFASDQLRGGMLLLLQQVMGVRALVETDDNYLVNPGADILKRSGWAMKIGEKPFTREGHKAIVRRADGVIVTTEALARSYRRLNPNVFICPNTVDPVDWPEPVKPDDGIFRIGWSASRSHIDDIPLVTRALEWASQQKDVQVFTHGLRPTWKFKWGHIPWDDDIDAYRTRMMHFDVGLAPVRITPFTLGRSDVKALEYSMGGALPLLSDVPPYSLWQHEHNCLKAKDARDFYHQIKWCVQHRDEVKQLAAEASRYTREQRTTAAQIHTWQEAIDG